MSHSEITVRLEYIIEERGREPYQQATELAITEYGVGETVPGRPILGLQIKEDDESERRIYRLYRIADALPIPIVDETETPPRTIQFKISWHSRGNLNDGVTAAYDVTGQENLAPEISEERDDLEWKYLVTEEQGRYHLVHVIPQAAGNVTPCEVLAIQGIDCSHPRLNPIEKTQCRSLGCLPRPPRPWWQRIVRR